MENFVWTASIVILAVAILGLLEKTVVLTSMTVVQTCAKIMEPVKMVSIVILAVLGLLEKTVVLISMTVVQTCAKIMEPVKMASILILAVAILDLLSW
jgi:hypothetical protein